MASPAAAAPGGGVLWGTFDEHAGEQSFQAALDDWRGGGAAGGGDPAGACAAVAAAGG
jgi:hypothetical protein